ncbi:hypothetical protein [Variovorax saccharolyticus]|uniref:hypothetical protein n=1 Tax=Variovorax saccharolyticus TaxID=3053516 RepID=UPI0025754EA8|nr:hypothetical protein [Variovorax sp. J22R187]MDM0018373.1 hypothetical protein [Variovorax sp. J22R187]
MALKHDMSGFLVGEIIKTNDQLLTVQQDGVRLLSNIRTEVSSIARAISVQMKMQERSTVSGQGGHRVHRITPAVSPAGRAGSRMVGSNQTVGPASRGGAPGARRVSASVAVPTGRDDRGRFVAGQSKGAAGGAALGSVGGGLARLSEGIGKLSASLAATNNLDPTTNALKEVTDVVTPLGRGMSSMFGRSAERKKERWNMRFWTALKAKPRVEVVGGGRTGVGIVGGIGQGLGAGLGGMLGAGAGAAAGGVAGLLGKGGRLLMRVPMLGALLAGGSALASVFGDGDRASKFRGVGEAGGMLAGGLAGAKGGALVGSLLGPIGTAVGIVIGGVGGAIFGEKFGAKVGEWTQSLIDSDIGGKAVAAWDVTTAGIGAAWDSLVADAKTTWGELSTTVGEWWGAAKSAAQTVGDKLGSIVDGADEWLKSKGINVGEIAGNAWKDAKAMAGEAASRAYDVLVPNTVKRAINAGSAAATQAKAGYDEARGSETMAPAPSNSLEHGARAAGGGLGNMIAKHEGGYGSFNRGNAGDSGGATMDFSSMTVSQIMAAQSLKKGDANRLFAVGKYQVIPSTMQGAAKAMGLTGDEKFTPELQERIFAEYLTAKKRPQIAGYIKGEHDNLASAQLAGAQEWASIADPKSGKSYYAGSGNNRAGMSADTFGSGLTDARGRYKTLIAQGVAPDTAYASALRGGVAVAGLPTMKSIDIPPSVPAQLPEQAKNEVPEKLNSGAAASGKVQVSLKDRTSQNIGDRGIAHIVSGGIGGA